MNQQQTGGQIQTGNPQQAPIGTGLQPSSSQNANLQNAGVSSIDAIRALDQGDKTLTVSGTSSSIALPFANTTTTTVQTTENTASDRNETAAYIIIGLVVVACLAILAYGLLKPKKYKPSK